MCGTGIVQNADADVIKLDEDLVTCYVNGNYLILVALPMTGERRSTGALLTCADYVLQMTLKTRKPRVSRSTPTPMVCAPSASRLLEPV